jgi:hypothetical protein
MSGYLGRMVAAAGASKPSLHPFAGSIYENGAQSWAGRPNTGRDADATDGPERHLIVEADDDGHEAADRSRTPLVARRAVPDAQNPAALVSDYAPLYPQRHDNRLAPVSPASSRTSNLVEQELTLPQAAPAELAAEDAPANNRLGRRAVGDPLTGEAASRLLPLAPTVTRSPSAAGRAAAIESTTSSSTGRDTSSGVAPRTADNQPREVARAVTAAPLPARAAPPRHADSRTREPFRSSGATDQSVEIHIGRVEVLAVTPPAPRTPTANQSRTTSLADYLARRSGRTR